MKESIRELDDEIAELLENIKKIEELIDSEQQKEQTEIPVNSEETQTEPVTEEIPDEKLAEQAEIPQYTEENLTAQDNMTPEEVRQNTDIDVALTDEE